MKISKLIITLTLFLSAGALLAIPAAV